MYENVVQCILCNSYTLSYCLKISQKRLEVEKVYTEIVYTDGRSVRNRGNSSVDRVETRNCVSCCMWHAKRLVATACDSIHLPNKSLTATH